MNTFIVDGTAVVLPVRIIRTPDGWVLPAMSAPIDNPDALTAATVAELRNTIAQMAWDRVKSGILPINPATVTAIRLFSTVATVHPRNAEAAGPVIQVPAVADRAKDGWVVAVACDGALSGRTAHGATFGETSQALVTTLMLELEMGGTGLAENWSGIELQVTTRKTVSVSALA